MKKIFLLLAICLIIPFNSNKTVTMIKPNPPMPTIDVFAEATNKVVKEEEFKNGDQIVLQFSAVWCGPCRILKEIVKSTEVQSAIKESLFGYFIIDIDSDKEVDKKWVDIVKPSSIPLVVKFEYQDGTWVEQSRFLGVRPAEFLIDFIRG